MAATRRAAWRAFSTAHSTRVPLGGVQQQRASSSRIPGSARPSRLHPRPASNRHVSAAQAGPTQSLAGSRPDAVEPVVGDTVVVPAGSHEVAEAQADRDAVEPSSSSLETILGQDTLVVTRQVEMMNVFLGFEQSNKYTLNSAQGEPVGYLAESEKGVLGGSIQRQVLRTHRPFEAQVLDTNGNVMMIIRRSFTFINSKIRIFSVDVDTREELLIGEVHQVFHVIRRKYDLYISRGGEKGEEEMEQFAQIDEGLWAWDFMLKDDESRPLGAISRNFRGLGRELFTDTGQYVLTFDPTTLSSNLRIEGGKEGEKDERKSMGDTQSGLELVTSGPARQLTTQERAVALATAVSADFDYFSRHSEGSSTGGFLPWYWMMGSGGSQQQGTEPSPEAGPPSNQKQDSSGVEAAPGAPGSDGGLGPAVGTGVGYDMLGRGSQPSAPPPPTTDPDSPPPDDFGKGQEDVWGSDDPWGDDDAGAGGDAGSGSSWGWTDIFDGDS